MRKGWEDSNGEKNWTVRADGGIKWWPSGYQKRKESELINLSSYRGLVSRIILRKDFCTEILLYKEIREFIRRCGMSW